MATATWSASARRRSATGARRSAKEDAMRRSKAGALIGALALSAAGGLALAQDTKKPETAGGHAGHIVVTPDDVQWTAGPGTIPAGTKMAVIEGDPSKPGLF